MSAWPSDARVMISGFGEKFDPSVRRTEMERGMAKQSIINTHVEQEINVTVIFESKQASINFEEWYFNEIKRIGYFNIKHPRTGQLLEARIKKGDIGELTPVRSGFGLTQRAMTLEYLR